MHNFDKITNPEFLFNHQFTELLSAYELVIDNLKLFLANWRNTYKLIYTPYTTNITYELFFKYV
jgi:hypothetical protein